MDVEQNEDGGWRLHIEGHSIMFVAIINYIWCESLEKGLMVVKIMRLQELANGSLTMAEQLISLLGGRFGFRLVTKFSPIPGISEWSGTNPVPPEIWLLLYFVPIYIQEICGAIVKWFICLSYLFGRSLYTASSYSLAIQSTRIIEFLVYFVLNLEPPTFNTEFWESTVETGFIIQALFASNLVTEVGQALKICHDFIKSSQFQAPSSVPNNHGLLSQATSDANNMVDPKSENTSIGIFSQRCAGEKVGKFDLFIVNLPEKATTNKLETMASFCARVQNFHSFPSFISCRNHLCFEKRSAELPPHVYNQHTTTLHDIAMSLQNGQKLSAGQSDYKCSLRGAGREIVSLQWMSSDLSSWPRNRKLELVHMIHGTERTLIAILICPSFLCIDHSWEILKELVTIPLIWQHAWDLNVSTEDDLRCPCCSRAPILLLEILPPVTTRQLIIRLTSAVEPTETKTGGCINCRQNCFSDIGFDDCIVIIFDQELPADKWFCCEGCNRIHFALVDHYLKGAEFPSISVVEAMNMQLAEKGLCGMAENKMYFNPLVTSCGRDLIPVMVYELRKPTPEKPKSHAHKSPELLANMDIPKLF
ncbi:Amyrin synthase LUP2-like protein [Drosera capensis]